MDYEKMTVLLTGATGSLGTALTFQLLSLGAKVRAYARNEHGHTKLMGCVPEKHLSRLSSLIGDVRDHRRLTRAAKGTTHLIHAAALKIISLAEYDPMEAVKTNVIGTLNVIDAVLDCGIERAALVSTDKASSPINLYGATKLCAERLWLNANRYRGDNPGVFIAVRYGNVWGSQGSIIHKLTASQNRNGFNLTDSRMTRFHITLERAVSLVLMALFHARPGELLVPKLPAYRLTDLARAIDPQAPLVFTGRRPGEKLSETMISENESCFVVGEERDHYRLDPSQAKDQPPWEYSSSNTNWLLSKEELQSEVEKWRTRSS